MFKENAFLKKIFPCFAQQEQIKQLAERLYSIILELSNLPQEPKNNDSDVDALEVLQSSQLLLENLLSSRQVKSKDDSEEIDSLDMGTISDSNNEMALPRTAEEIIQLRDWVLMAKISGEGASAEVITSFYDKLGEILENEGIIPLEATQVPFDYEKHQIIGVEVTDDPSKNDQIFSTIRPGYLFNNLILRSQEVILYTLEKS